MLWHRDGALAVMVNHVMMGDGRRTEETAAEERERDVCLTNGFI